MPAAEPEAAARALEETPTETALREILQGVGSNGEALVVTNELLKRIVELLLPKAAQDGPTLTELLAALLSSMRELLLVSKSNGRAIDEILQRLGTVEPAGSVRPKLAVNGHST